MKKNPKNKRFSLSLHRNKNIYKQLETKVHLRLGLTNSSYRDYGERVGGGLYCTERKTSFNWSILVAFNADCVKPHKTCNDNDSKVGYGCKLKQIIQMITMSCGGVQSCYMLCCLALGKKKKKDNITEKFEIF